MAILKNYKSISAMITASNFENYFPTALQIIDDYLKSMTVDFVRNHFIELVKYSTKGGKKLRGVLTSSIYCELLHISPESKEAYPGYILGWAFEIAQAAYLVADDLMDQSKMRRGQPCWYLRENVGNSAVNDALIVENLAFVLIESLRNNGQPKENCLPDDTIDHIIRYFRNTTALTTVGQGYDFKCKTYSFDSYNIIVNSKTAHYTIIAPIISSIIASRTISEEVWSDQKFNSLLEKIGYYFQAQDDFLDVYGVPSVTGKIGTDIAEGKVTWIACTAIQNANEQQKEIILNNIGKNDEESIARVKKVYDELNIPQFYAAFTEKENALLEEGIKILNDKLPKQTIEKLIKMLLSRNS